MTPTLRSALTASLCAVALGVGCAASSPTLSETRSALANPDTIAIAAQREGRAAAAAQPPGAPECLDAAFSGSPDQGAEAARVAVPCWKALLQLSPDFKHRAEQARADAERRRRADQALAKAEARACSELGELEVALSPFAHDEDIEAVAPLHDGDQLAGARVTFAAVPGLEVDHMRRVVACHLARAQVICDPEAADYCPLVLQGVQAFVAVEGDQIVIEVRSPSEEGAREVIARLRGDAGDM